MIGYKMWGSLLARALTAAGLIVVIPDYRNYPGSSVPTMVDVDVETSIQWICDNIEDYGGNKHQIILVGQSAGGHLLCTALLRKAIRIATTGTCRSVDIDNDDSDDLNNSNNTTCWQPTDFVGFITLSAPYDLSSGMKDTFRRHGLNDDIVNRIFGFQIPAYEPSSLLDEYMNDNPTQQAHQEHESGNDSSFMKHSSSPRLQHWSPLKLPPIRIYHGTRDKTVPVEGAMEFATALGRAVAGGHCIITDDDDDEGRAGAVVTYSSYPDWSHTDAILECPMDSNHLFHCDIFQAVQDWTNTSKKERSRSPLVVTNSDFAGLEQEHQQENSTGRLIQSPLTTTALPRRRGVASAAAATVATAADPLQQQQQQQPVQPPNNGAGDDNSPGLVWPKDDPVIRYRLCPHALIQIGRWCNPF